MVDIEALTLVRMRAGGVADVLQDLVAMLEISVMNGTRGHLLIESREPKGQGHTPLF
jgi:hypothetical protein